MASKRAIENKKDKNIHKTAKNKSAAGKEKRKQTDKTTDVKKGKNETKTNSKIGPKNDTLLTSKETRPSSERGKQSNEKTLIIDDDDLEGMTVPPKDAPSSPQPEGAPPEARVGQRPTARPAQPPRQPSAPAKRPPRPKSPVRRKKEESSDDDGDGDEEEIPVKQFSFPAYKILSGASVAPVQMYPQKVVINQTVESNKRHWGTALTGLFQNSKLTLKLRMLRLLLIWIFFRVLNKQTAWLSDMLGIGVPEPEPPGPKVKPPPGERFVRVFREGDPNPFHVKVKRPL